MPSKTADQSSTAKKVNVTGWFFRTVHIPTRISLRTKFIIFISGIISVFYLFVLYRTAVFDEQLILKQAEQQARMLYKQILLTRQWASDHNGLFILKKEGSEANPYLDLPTMTDNLGQTYFLRNPAMITRELASYAKKDGFGHFRVTSLDPVNPLNQPDLFEKVALQAFVNGAEESIDIDQTPEGRIFRFMAPLHVNDSCLGCHARHGYQRGDLRGGLSIAIPINWVDDLVGDNIRTLLLIGIASILTVSLAIFLMFETLIVKRIGRLSQAMANFPRDSPENYFRPPVFRDELDVVSDHFVLFCKRLSASQEALLQAKTQAHLSEKMASLGILSAGIAHEVNNPLGGMLNCVKSMRENPQDLELTARYLPLLDKGLRRIEKIMRQLLNFGRTEPLKTRRIDITLLIEECAALLGYRLKNIELVTKVKVDGEHFLDAEALKQIVINIGLNAIQAMPDGGRLEIDCRQEGEMLLFRFSDTGLGIAPENLPRIFDPFYTTKEVGEGTGLGLAVTYALAERMAGRIVVESWPGKGTIFTLTIPPARSTDDSPPPPQNPPQETANLHQG
jgi:two-component system, NtrC family, sensor kinase